MPGSYPSNYMPGPQSAPGYMMQGPNAPQGSVYSNNYPMWNQGAHHPEHAICPAGAAICAGMHCSRHVVPGMWAEQSQPLLLCAGYSPMTPAAYPPPPPPGPPYYGPSGGGLKSMLPTALAAAGGALLGDVIEEHHHHKHDDQ
jgi:hypothetical protein